MLEGACICDGKRAFATKLQELPSLERSTVQWDVRVGASRLRRRGRLVAELGLPKLTDSLVQGWAAGSAQSMPNRQITFLEYDLGNALSPEVNS